MATPEFERELRTRLEREIVRSRQDFPRSKAVQVEAQLKRAYVSLKQQMRRDYRRPPEAGLPVPAIPPKGPLPLQGGAEAPLDFDRP